MTNWWHNARIRYRNVKTDTLEVHPENRKERMILGNNLSQFQDMKDLKTFKLWEHQFAYGYLTTECLEGKINPGLLLLQLTGSCIMTKQEHESLITFLNAIA